MASLWFINIAEIEISLPGQQILNEIKDRWLKFEMNSKKGSHIHYINSTAINFSKNSSSG